MKSNLALIAMALFGILLIGSLNIVYSQVDISNAKFSVQDRFGTAKIIGQVKNTGNDTVSNVNFGLTGYDRNGEIVIVKTDIPVTDSLAPNQKASFDTIEYKEDFEGMKLFELSLKWTASNGSEIYVDNAYNKTTEED